jgi:predicted PurR-regulated permease PerM
MAPPLVRRSMEQTVTSERPATTDGLPRAGLIAGVLVGVATALGLLYVLRDIVVPLFVALLLMALIDALVRGLRRLWPKSPQLATSIAAGLIVTALLAVCVFILFLGAGQIVAQAPALAARLNQVLADLGRIVGVAAPPSLYELVSPSTVMSAVTPALSGIGNAAAGATLVVLYLGFMLASRPLLLKKIGMLARTPDGAAHLRGVMDRVAHAAGTYMWVQTVTGAIYAVASGAALYLIGLDNVLFWTVLIFLLSYIPVLGVAAASAGPALFALLQFPTYWQAVAAFVAVQVFAFLVGNVLLPKIQADSQNIDPTVAIFSVALWTLLWGVPGAFLAIPLTVMTMIVFAQFEQTRWAAILISNDGTP